MEFVSISRVINHMTCYNTSALIGGKFIHKKSFTRFALQSECCNFNQWEDSNLLQVMWFLTWHILTNFQLKTTHHCKDIYWRYRKDLDFRFINLTIVFPSITAIITIGLCWSLKIVQNSTE
jgi:hypothetical protein